MRFDKPRDAGTAGKSDRPKGTVNVAFIGHEDPLPLLSEPEGRWFVPFRSDRDGLWHCYLRCHLTREQENAGLLSHVAAPTREELDRLMAEQDHKAERSGPGTVPAYRYRATR
jgi:hypothetical protein